MQSAEPKVLQLELVFEIHTLQFTDSLMQQRKI
jgi:hypothetical protein